MRPRFRRSLLASAVLAATLLLPAKPAFAFTDVPSSYWAYTQINYVAQTHAWMQDYGTSQFKPNTNELRKYLARTLVTVYAPGEPEDPSITFPDLPKSDPFYHYANVAVKLGWMPKYDTGKWAPNSPPVVRGFDKALVLAMGLQDAVEGLDDIHEKDGDRYSVDEWFPYVALGRSLGLHFNHATESMDIQDTEYIQRDEAAYSLWKAKTSSSYTIDSIADRMANITLGSPSTTGRHALVQYALSQVGYPYIWGGEWHAESPSGYCCGYQPQGGMDCSGFVWWTVKKNEYGYNAAQFHPGYAGWSVPQRTSSTMAQSAPSHITLGNLRIGDLVFFASNYGNTWQDVDHVGIYVGNNWIIDSASSADGPGLHYIGSGWYFDTFVYGRRVIGVASSDQPVGVREMRSGDRDAGF